MDLLAEASYGLFEATSKFDPSRGNKFITYAHRCIWNRLKKYIRESMFPYRLSASEVSRLLMVKRYIRLSKEIDNTLPPIEDISAVTNISERECKRMLYFVENENDPVPNYYNNGYGRIELMKDLKGHLSEDEYDILIAVFGLDGAPPRKQREIAKEKEISDEMVKVKKQEALFRLSKLFREPDTLLFARAAAAQNREQNDFLSNYYNQICEDLEKAQNIISISEPIKIPIQNIITIPLKENIITI